VYGDGLSKEFQDYSWASLNWNETGVVHSGTEAIRMNPGDFAGLYLYKERVAKTEEYPVLEFWIHGGTEGNQKLRLVLNAGGEQVAEKTIDELLPEGKIVGGTWQKATLAIKELNIPNGLYDGILLQGNKEGGQPAVYIDDIVLRSGAANPPQKPTAQLTAFTVSPEQISLKKGETSLLQTLALYSDGSSTEGNNYAQWSSSQPSVASVENGLLRALEPGSSVITATYQGLSARANISVTAVTPTPQPGGQEPKPLPQVTGLIVYDEAVQDPFQDYSWAERDVNYSGIPAYTGTKSIQYNPSGGAGLYLYKGDGSVMTGKHDRLEFWINGGAAGGQQLELQLNSGGGEVAKMSLNSIVEGGRIPANRWVKAAVNLSELKLPNGIFDGILLRGSTEGAQEPVYIDDMHILEKYIAPAELTEVLLSQYEMVLLPEDRIQLELVANYNDGTSRQVADKAVWSSSDSQILSVAGGTVTAKQQGVAKITAAYGSVTASAYAQVTAVMPDPVYKDAPEEGYTDWSWGTRSMEASQPVHTGSRSISFHAKGYEGIWLHQDKKEYDANQYYGVDFWVHGGAAGGQQLNLVLMDDRSAVGSIELSKVLPQSGIQPDTWTKVRVKLADMGMSGSSFDGIVLQAWGEQDQGTIYIDDIDLLINSNVIDLPDPELPKVAVSVTTAEVRHALSPDLFGVNFEENPSENASKMKFPMVRWGGNQMSRYNWELDVTNRAGDWYFLNLTNDTPDPSKLPFGSLSDRFITKAKNDGSKVLLQIPTIGWTPKSRDVTWSYSISKYGNQSGNECDWGESWCRRDAGNGLKPGGQTYMTGNDPNDTAKPYGKEFMSRWIDHLKGQFGSYVRHYALDNEPALWGHTHRDIHPEMTTYDEIWKYTTDYAGMIKQKDPGSKVYGPVSWGWCEYFYSAKDGCYPGQDMEDHGGKPFLEWYLSKVTEHKNKTGTQLVDVLDIHYYPAENGITFTSDESAATSKRRLQALKSLYDPSYQDPTSWIQEPVRLIPRMKEMIERNAPGTGLAITEYNFGDGNGISSGLAQAEALAIFAREGVDLATRWGALPGNTPLEDAFKLYLNYDGNGSRIEGNIVSATSSNIDAVGAYTIQSAAGKTYTLLFNKDTAPRSAEVSLDRNVQGNVNVYMFNSKQRLHLDQTIAASSSSLTVKLPARSATLIVSP
jgi:hypothetical protein